MPLELLTETSMLPFPSNPGDWFNSYQPESDEMVYIEHPVIIALMKHRGEQVVENPVPPPGTEGTDGARWVVNLTSTYTEYGNALCRSIVRWLLRDKPPRQHGTAVEFYLPDFPPPMILGFFGGRTFVFFDKR